MLTPIILCGGKGARLWPLSRELYPKHFIPLINGRTPFQETLLRLQFLDATPPIIVSNNDHRFMAEEQLRLAEVSSQAIILEPEARNTAPAMALAALFAVRNGEDPLLLVLPSDHDIRDTQAFADAVHSGMGTAESGRLVTFGIPPNSPETGYGYIRRGSALNGSKAFAVENFLEKPTPERALEFLQSGEYFWNSGMFLFQASSFLESLRRFAPDMYTSCEQAVGGIRQDLGFLRVEEKAFLACPSDSIDYAVMEKADNAAVVPLEAGWSDLGSFAALQGLPPTDASENKIIGDVLARKVSRSYLNAGHALLAVLGLEDVVVVVTKDAVLVAHKDHSQDVKSIVATLKQAHRKEVTAHSKVYRPWGSYETLGEGQRFQVKRITVKPEAELSLQMHHHRSEHWVMVTGTAEVTRGEEVFLLTENESAYIPLGTVHRLKNPGLVPLELIEVQSGAYLGEDDIVRLEDHYGRQGQQDKY